MELLAEQRRRWQNGERILVETYLERLPELRENQEAVLDLIYNEFVAREEQGERPRPDEYLARFPQLASHLHHQLELHEALGDFSLSAEQPEDSLAQTELPDAADAGYAIQEELGRGGMGVVYRAYQLALKRPVALKMILAGEYAGARERERFRTEAEVVARLQHPNIVQIYEVGELSGRPFVALEFVEGGNLAQRLAGTPQPARPAAHLAETLARAVHYAHQHHIVHRDLKPANVLLSPEGPGRKAKAEEGIGTLDLGRWTPKIADFGLAKLLDVDSGHTPSEAFLGTPNYMAPEQAEGKARDTGPRADVYSLGAILYELLTGRPPFRGATPLDTLEQVRTQDPVPPRRLLPKVPRDLETVCLKCLEKDPGRRYASAEALADDLGRFRAGEPVQARPASLAQRVAKWTRRRPTAAALVAVCGAAAIGLIALLIWYEANQRKQAVLEQQVARQAAHTRFQDFIRRRDEALFQSVYGSLAGDADGARSVSAARQSARDALDSVGFSADATFLPTDPLLTDGERAEISSGCYELLLILADTVAHAAPLASGDARAGATEALGYLDQAARLGMVSQAYHRRRASYLKEVGRDAEADQETESASSIQPSGALDRFLLGDERYRRRELQAAMADFEDTLRHDPAHFWARYYLALCHLELHRPAEARVGLTATLQRRPEFVWTYLLRGLANAELRTFAAAEEDFQEAARLGPGPDADYALHVNRGALRLQEGDYAAAAADLETAVRARPDVYRAYVNLARVYRKQHHPKEALEQLENAARLQPPVSVVADLRTEQAGLLLEAKSYAEARHACDLALQLRADLPEAQRILGEVHLECKEYEAAARAFSRSLELGGPPAIYRRLGLAHMQAGDFPAAVDDYTRAMRPDPDASVYTHRGWAYFFNDAWKLAGRDFDEALRQSSDETDAYVGRALVRINHGDVRAALADAEEARRRKPDTPEMLHNLACVYAQIAARAESSKETDTAALAAPSRRQAVEVLRQALNLVPAGERDTFWREKMLPDPALHPLRTAGEFKDLVKELADSRQDR